MKPIMFAAIEAEAGSTATVWTYIAYLLVSVALTIWVARTLHKNGRIFLVDSFLGNEALALKYGDKATDARTAVETLSTKVGLVLVVLGVMHFFNLFIFSKMRRRATSHRPPPIQPQGHVKTMPG